MNSTKKITRNRNIRQMSALIIFSLIGCTSISKSVSEYRKTLHKEALSRGAMAWAEFGSKGGKPIVLLHGLPTSSYLYRKISLAPDLLGFGLSAKVEDIRLGLMRF